VGEWQPWVDLDRLRKTYCGKIGVEYMHISDPDQKAWIQERIEHVENRTEFTVEGRHMILSGSSRRKGWSAISASSSSAPSGWLDGGESMIPGIEQILKRGGQLASATW
jgi:2-oxoglutarate dehydrogenase E1 component